MTALSGEFGLILLIAGAAGAAATWFGLKRGQIVVGVAAGIGFVLNYHTVYTCDKDMFEALVALDRDGDNCKGALTAVSLGGALLNAAAWVVGVFLAAIAAALALKRAWRFATVEFPAWRAHQQQKALARRLAREEKARAKRALRYQRHTEKQARGGARVSKPHTIWYWDEHMFEIVVVLAAISRIMVISYLYYLSYSYTGMTDSRYICLNIYDLKIGFRIDGHCKTMRLGPGGIEYLDLAFTQVSDLTPLQGMTRLRELDLRSTQVRDLTPLQGMTALEALGLENTQVSDLTPLAGMTALEELYLGGTQVSDLTPLQAMTALQWLDLDNTQVSDLTPLQAMTALQGLWLNNTQVSDLTPLQAMTALQGLALSST